MPPWLQACAVSCNYLLLAGSVDDKMWDMIKRKQEDLGSVLDGAKGKLQVCATASHTATCLSHLFTTFWSASG